MDIKQAVSNRAGEAREFLKSMIQYKSTPGNESELIQFCREEFSAGSFEAELAPVPEEIKDDPEYSRADTPMSYEGRANLLVNRKGKGGGRSVILQSHSDVVPADDWADAFQPREDGDVIFGRGACDAKGPIAAIWLALQALGDLGVELRGDIQAQIVIEEEVGGNGALSLIRQGHRADAVVVIEPTQLQIHPANRGAIWFRIEVEGLPCHMGRKHEGISAIDLSYKIIQALYEYEKRIIADSAGYPGFERYTNPVQVNVGMLHSGTWPAMVAANAAIEGGVGFLPNRSMEQVKMDVREVIEGIDDEWLRGHYKLEFPKLHNDSYETDFSHPAVIELEQAARATGIESDVFGWNVSCDARLYSRLGGMPVMVFGPGSILDAHARGEKVDFNEVVQAAEVLARFLVEWCG